MSRTSAEGPGCRGVELRVAGPDDLLHAVPYLLGFHPAESLVLVGLRASQLVVTIRVGLADLTRPDVLADAVQASSRAGVTDLVGAVYLPADAARDVGSYDCSSLPVLGVLRAAAAEAGLTVLDMLMVHDGRWRSAWCAGDCCPAEGTPLGEKTSVFAAAATYAGMAVLPNRAAMMSVLDPRPDHDRARLSPLIAEAENAIVRAALDGQAERSLRSIKRAVFAAARAADAAIRAADADLVCDAETARFGVALSRHELRDAVWMAVDDGRLDGRRLWSELARRLPAPYDAAALFLFGWCAWRAGNGALATAAADRAIASDPAYSAADLLLAAIARGVDPLELPRLRLPRR